MTHITDATPPRRVVIVGAGFAGVHAARRLARLAGRQVAVTLINPTDYFLYLPLLPEVTAGVLDPRRVAVPLRTACPGARLLLGTVDRVDLPARRVEFTDPEGGRRVGRLRPPAAHGGQRQQAVAHPRGGPARPRVPECRRGAVPA